ncbi:hypothetical protein B0A52_01456 [Exophiala mesophila]|uniref:Uncharacterized protein n=1 Tax=Exophiala mesophila TaxID=212818 RepID=A0A438NF55_EXOME|nr:hypothetical protein B0A52_01456 [Exophiala mesophila]
MPTKWLSVRKRKPVNQPSDLRHPTKTDFDFAFDEILAADSTLSIHLQPRPVDLTLRPKTSGGPGRRGGRVEALHPRPRTSDRQKPSTLRSHYATVKPNDSHVGLALVARRHPRQNLSISPQGSSPKYRYYSPGTENHLQMQSKRWKKFGVLFKNRNQSFKRDESSQGPSIGLPTGLVVLDKNPEVALSKHEFSTQQAVSIEPPEDVDAIPPPPIEKSPRLQPPPPPPPPQPTSATKSATKSGDHDNDDAVSIISSVSSSGSINKTYVRPPLPKLELDIPVPSPPFDRYSVMFRSIPANRSSSLLARRSRALDSLKSLEDSRPTTKEDEDEKVPAQAAAESLPPHRRPRGLTSPMHRPTPSKYSLFPTASPAPAKILNNQASTAAPPQANTLQLKRSATSPARLSPMQDHFSNIKPEPLQPRRFIPTEALVDSPDDNTASTTKSNPWSADHSLQSSVSSNTTVDDIFFDIKSFRDSKGVEDGNFVMTRPDSVAVELCRTRSKGSAQAPRPRINRGPPPTLTLNYSSLAESSIFAPKTRTTQTSAATTKHTSVNTAYFEEAIAAVERLTSPTTAEDSAQVKISPLNLASLGSPITAMNLLEDRSHHKTPEESHLGLRIGGKSHFEVGRTIPSPVVEVKEDVSPKVGYNQSPQPSVTLSLPKQPTPQPPSEAEPKKVAPARREVIKRLDRPCDDSPTLPQGPPFSRRNFVASPLSPTEDRPPPVPEKDAKFIPISRFAAKGTINAVERTIQPHKTHFRNESRNLAPINTSVRGKDQQPTSSTAGSAHTGSPASGIPKSSLQGLEITVPPSRPNPVALNPVSSSDMVAVARTVSLSRKRSTHVQIPAGGGAGGLAAIRQRAKRSETHPQAAAATATATLQKHQHQHQQSLQHQHTHQHQASSSISSHRRSGSRSNFFGHRRARSGSRSQSKDKIRIAKREVPIAETKEKEKAMIKEARKWEILEKKSYSPMVIPAERGHRPGLSVGLVVENT